MNINALREATQEMKRAEGIGEDHPAMLASSLALVQAYAAIAQAEYAYGQAHAGERIAESLERALPILSRIADALYSGEGSPLSLALADLVKLIHAQVAENGAA